MTSPNWSGVPGTRPMSAMCGRDVRYRSSSSETPIPMNSPGSVSKIRTPNSAASEAVKSGRAATANRLAPLVAELAEIARFLRSREAQLLSLVGPGGIGKTRLALQAVARCVEPEVAFDLHFPDGVYFVPLAAEEQEEYFPPKELQKLVTKLRKEMLAAAKDLDFEKAAALRDRIRKMEARGLELP